MRIKASQYTEKEIMKILREWTELTQKNFGESIGRIERTIKAYEQGESNYTFKTLKEICRVHGIDIIFEKNEK